MDEATPNPLDVALVIDHLTFDRMGPVIGHLSIGLLDFVNQITLVTPASAAQQLSLGPVRVIHYAPPSWAVWDRGARPVLEGLGAQVPSLIHAISSRSFHLAQGIAGQTGRPLIGHLLGSEDLHPRWQPVFDRMTQIIAASKPLLDLATERQLTVPDRLNLVRPGLLTEPAPSCFMQPNLMPTVLCMSAFERGTGVDRLIEAMGILAKEHQELMLFLVATGPEERRLRRLVEQHQLIKSVTFSQPLTDWARAMRAADIFVVPSDVDRVDLRLLHAQAAGMAAVTGRMSNSDFVIHGRTALVCPQPTPEALAGAIRTLVDDRPTAINLATEALEHCKSFHSLSRMAELTAEVYRKVVASTAT